MNRHELEQRLINFAVSITNIVKNAPENKVSNYLVGQLLRSGISPALNYGEAQSGESRKDFIHKMQIALKELRETNINLRILNDAKLEIDTESIIKAIQESSELIAIFVRSIQTSTKAKIYEGNYQVRSQFRGKN